MSDRPTFETLLYTHEAKVATITLHRPEAANAFNEIMFQELYNATPTCPDTGGYARHPAQFGR